MSDTYLACPFCGCLKFYVWGETGEMVIFQVTADLQPVPAGGDAAELERADFSQIHCLACAWFGELSELRPVV